jgi:hypothetical protein
MNDLERLIALEEIKQLKARYWRAVDTRDVALLRGVFADGAEIDLRVEMQSRGDDTTGIFGPDVFAPMVIERLDGVISAHHGHAPEIEFVSDTEAKGLWPMEDNLWVDSDKSALPFKHLRGFGVYHERYVKTAAGWRIAFMTLKRVKVEIS